MSGPVIGEDGIARCAWAGGPGLMRDYHDSEWGVPVSGDTAHFERLTLEAFQSGLSWATILRKREAFRQAFAGFEPAAVAEYGERDVARLMADAGIVRNLKKIEATLVNARALIAWQADSPTPDPLARLVAEHRPAVPVAPTVLAEAPTTSPESLALSKALKKRGFTFVGPTTMHALMEALGVVDGHLVGCHRRGVGGF
jgi:DNA-3-methyladenine glycosylase I